MTVARTWLVSLALGLPLLVACGAAPTESTGSSEDALCRAGLPGEGPTCGGDPAPPKQPPPVKGPPPDRCLSLGTSCSTAGYGTAGIPFQPSSDTFENDAYWAGCTPAHLIDVDPTHVGYAYTMCPISAGIPACGNLSAAYGCVPISPCDRCTGEPASGWMWVVFDPWIGGSPAAGCSSGSCKPPPGSTQHS